MTCVEPGAVLGPIQLKKVLRKGAVANVYEGHHMRLGTDVAVSVMSAARGEDRHRFMTEARKATELKHPGLVRVLDFGEHGDVRYLCTALTQGTTLEQHLAAHKEPLPEAVILRVLRSVAEALGAAHAAGLAHRELRASSVLFDRRGQIKIIDLAVAPSVVSLSAPEDSFADRSPYLPPECAKEGALLGEVVDLWALGVIAYELAFQRRPYRCSGADPEETVEPARFDLPTHCSPCLVGVIASLVELDPDARIRTSPELLGVLPDETTSAEDQRPEPSEPSAAVREFAALLRMLQQRFGSRASESAAGTVLHSTLRERLLVWCLLAALGGTVIVGWLAR